MDNRERETELRLLREVMQWTGLQTGIFDLGKRDAYTEKDFQHLEDFLLSRFPGNEKLKRENIYGYISAKSLHRFWKSEEEKGGDVRKILSVIAISNRNPFVDIPVRRSGEHYKPVVDLWEEYRKIPAAEPEAAPATPEKIGRFKKQAMPMLLALGFLSFVFLGLFLLREKAAGWHGSSPVAEWDLYFRMRDEARLWKHPKLTFYKPVWDKEDAYIVKATGLYRKNDGSYDPDSAFSHTGKAVKLGEFLHFDLKPDDESLYRVFGNFHAKIYVGTEFNITEKDSYPYLGFGGGISGYRNDKTSNKQSEFIIYCKYPGMPAQSDDEVLNEMARYVNTDAIQGRLQQSGDPDLRGLIQLQSLRMNH